MAGSRPDNAPAEPIEFLAKHDPAIYSLALGLRQVVLDAIAPCHEYIFQMRSKVVLLYGATARIMADGICQIAILRHHVTLVFPDGISLEDPTRVLRGTGRIMRHVRVMASSDLARPELRSLLRQARALAGLADQPRRGRRDIVTRIKTSETSTSAPVDGLVSDRCGPSEDLRARLPARCREGYFIEPETGWKSLRRLSEPTSMKASARTSPAPTRCPPTR